ncbi:MAG: 50S ribosomal protein L9 [Alphaproteobacteria bacterium]|nr:50S ribosomal protein L9 [Alphaproteobacteria bacterium]MBF0129412.1 50S ribosomal protein L9 [Alphaproteobacteria bacterium]
MEVVLLERIEKLGQMGDVVKVKPGYARNFLLPRKKALRATKGNLEHFKLQRVQLEAADLKRRDEAQAVAAKMRGLSLVMVRQAGDSGQLYGSVVARDVADAIKEQGFTVLRSQVQLTHGIKKLGQYEVRVSLHPEVPVVVTVNVARSLEEASAGAAPSADLLLEDHEAAVEAEAAEAEAEAAVGHS